MPSIGILSLAPFRGTPYQQAFEGGLGSTPQYNFQDNKGYNPADFDTALNNLINDNQVQWIIAIGVLAEQKVAQSNRKHFISINAGAQSQPNPNHFKGRINLVTAGNNGQRIAHLANTFHITLPLCLTFAFYTTAQLDARRAPQNTRNFSMTME